MNPGIGVVMGHRIWCINCAGPALDAEADESESIAGRYDDRDEIHGFDDA